MLLLCIVFTLLLSLTKSAQTWNGGTWNGGTWNGGTWNGGTWNGIELNGIHMNGGTWNGGTWNGGTWNGGTWNGGTWNGGTWNGGTWNGGTWNGLGTNGLVFAYNGFPLNWPLNGLSFNDTALKDLPLSSISAKPTNESDIVSLLHYIVGCALPEGATWEAKFSDATAVYVGGFGLAPNYVDEPLTEEEARWLSACLLADVNAFGKHIYISVRNNPKVDASQEEMIDFPVYEGAFFGSLFTWNASAFSCQGTPEPQAIGDSPDRLYRVCTDPHDNCPFSIGYCADYCSDYTHRFGYAKCEVNGTVFNEVLNVYLREASSFRIAQSLLLLTIASLLMII